MLHFQLDWGSNVQDDIKDKAPSTIDRSSNVPVNDECRPALDLDKTRRQLGLGDDFIYTLLKDFNTKYETFEETLRAHLKRDDYKAARIYIHTLAGLTGTIAADEHHERARKLEASLAASDADIDIASIVESHNRLKSHISTIIGLITNMDDSAPIVMNTGNPK